MHDAVLDGLIRFVPQTAILFALVWIMIKIQKLDQNFSFHFLKLLGVVALAGALDQVPYVGWEISGAVLWLGIKKVTRSHYVDAIFTAVISEALLFCVNLFILGALLGDLRPATGGSAGSGPSARALPAQTATVESNLPASRHLDSAAAANPILAAVHNPVSTVAAESAQTNAILFTIKGITRHGAKSVVIIHAGTENHTLFLGDAFDLPTATGNSRVQFNNLDRDWVTLDIDGKQVKLNVNGNPVELPFR
jgi:hypothetical protein